MMSVFIWASASAWSLWSVVNILNLGTVGDSERMKECPCDSEVNDDVGEVSTNYTSVQRELFI